MDSQRPHPHGSSLGRGTSEALPHRTGRGICQSRGLLPESSLPSAGASAAFPSPRPIYDTLAGFADRLDGKFSKRQHGGCDKKSRIFENAHSAAAA